LYGRRKMNSCLRKNLIVYEKITLVYEQGLVFSFKTTKGPTNTKHPIPLIGHSHLQLKLPPWTMPFIVLLLDRTQLVRAFAGRELLEKQDRGAIK